MSLFSTASQKSHKPVTIAELARRVFQREHSLQLVPSALAWLENLCLEHQMTDEGDIVASFQHLVRECQSGGNGLDGPTRITAELLQAACDKLQMIADADPAAASDLNPTQRGLRVVDAFDMPQWNWSEEDQAYIKNTNHLSIAPNVKSKAQYLRDRFGILRQFVLRNEHFSAPPVVGEQRTDFMKLTSIKNLLGRQGGHFLIFGLLMRREDGAYCLEDLDDKVELDLSECTPESGLFTEGSFVLLDGTYTEDSIFKVDEMGHPPGEPREEARKVFAHVDFDGLGAISVQDERDLVAAERSPSHRTQFHVFSDLHLDNPKALKALEFILATCDDIAVQHQALLAEYQPLLADYEAFLEQVEAERGMGQVTRRTEERLEQKRVKAEGKKQEMDEVTPPGLFVFCGNFRSRPFLFNGEAVREYQDLFNSLCTLLLKFPTLLHITQLVFVPGPSDPWSSDLLPRPPLPDSITKPLLAKIPNVTFASNPCRIRWFSQEIVILREDTMSRMNRNAVRLGGDEGGVDMREALAQTILDQAHLAPLPLGVRPVLWDYDHALRLYPMPTTLILADKFDPYKLVYEGCLVCNPGSFARNKFGWMTYDPYVEKASQRMEQSEIDRDQIR